jgi:S1-C subfamily serine protease
VPIDALKPILGELLARGRVAASSPWLGLYAQEIQGTLFAVRVPTGGPAYRAGVRPGDVVLGVGDKPVTGLADFYRKVRGLGKAGVTVPVTVMRDNGPGTIAIKSMDRYDWLKLKMSY